MKPSNSLLRSLLTVQGSITALTLLEKSAVVNEIVKRRVEEEKKVEDIDMMPWEVEAAEAARRKKEEVAKQLDVEAVEEAVKEEVKEEEKEVEPVVVTDAQKEQQRAEAEERRVREDALALKMLEQMAVREKKVEDEGGFVVPAAFQKQKKKKDKRDKDKKKRKKVNLEQFQVDGLDPEELEEHRAMKEALMRSERDIRSQDDVKRSMPAQLWSGPRAPSTVEPAANQYYQDQQRQQGFYDP